MQVLIRGRGILPEGAGTAEHLAGELASWRFLRAQLKRIASLTMNFVRNGWGFRSECIERMACNFVMMATILRCEIRKTGVFLAKQTVLDPGPAEQAQTTQMKPSKSVLGRGDSRLAGQDSVGQHQQGQQEPMWGEKMTITLESET